MSRSSLYPWIWRRPTARRRRGRPMTQPPSTTCRRCGYDPVAGRTKCPACLLTTTDR